MPNYAPEIAKIYEYLSAPDLPLDAHPTIAFGRNDRRVAFTLGKLINNGLVTASVITGGVGKDTGDLLQRGYRSEAHYIDRLVRVITTVDSAEMPPIYLDEKAKHGGENARNSLSILQRTGHSIESSTATGHATSVRRLAETVRFEASRRGIAAPKVHRAPTDYSFDPRSPSDQAEAVDEFLRLADWPSQGLLLPQADIPTDLIDFAHDMGRPTPKPPSRLASLALGALPKPIQLHIIRAATR